MTNKDSTCTFLSRNVSAHSLSLRSFWARCQRSEYKHPRSWIQSVRVLKTSSTIKTLPLSYSCVAVGWLAWEIFAKQRIKCKFWDPHAYVKANSTIVMLVPSSHPCLGYATITSNNTIKLSAQAAISWTQIMLKFYKNRSTFEWISKSIKCWHTQQSHALDCCNSFDVQNKRAVVVGRVQNNPEGSLPNIR